MKESEINIEKQLIDLNIAIINLMKKREKFINEHMGEFAEFDIEEEVINIKTKEKTKVKEYYIYPKENFSFNDSFNVHCEFENGDNTSSYGPIHPFVKIKDKLNRTDNYIEKLIEWASKRTY